MVSARFEGIRDYGRLALVHARLFHRRWINPEIDDSILGSPDISSLADLQSAFETLAWMRVVPFDARSVTAVVIGVIAPMVPLIVFEVPLDELVVKVGRALVGFPE